MSLPEKQGGSQGQGGGQGGQKTKKGGGWKKAWKYYNIFVHALFIVFFISSCSGAVVSLGMPRVDRSFPGHMVRIGGDFCYWFAGAVDWSSEIAANTFQAIYEQANAARAGL